MLLEVGTYSRPFFGERINGDAVVTFVNNDYSYFVVIDGIGHGPKAGGISSDIKDYLVNNWITNPSKLIENVHNHMKGCEGAAIGISIINHKEARLTYAALGNISCRVIGSVNNSLIYADGLLGVRFRTIKNSEINLKNNDLIIMHSDGVSSSSTMSEILKFSIYSSRLLAKKIVQVYGSEYDDASCITVKCINK